jgi:hypothetical protein
MKLQAIHNKWTKTTQNACRVKVAELTPSYPKSSKTAGKGVRNKRETSICKPLLTHLKDPFSWYMSSLIFDRVRLAGVGSTVPHSQSSGSPLQNPYKQSRHRHALFQRACELACSRG